MKKFGFMSVVLAMVLTITACSGQAEPEPTPTNDSEALAVETAYVNMVEDTFNSGLTDEGLKALSDTTLEKLGPGGSDYEAAFAYLSTVVPLDHVYLNKEVNGGMNEVFLVMTYMANNTYGDVVTVKVDPTKVFTDGSNTATIQYSGVEFSSEKNDEFGLADYLNQAYQVEPEGVVVLKRVDGDWKVDPATLIPVIGTD